MFEFTAREFTLAAAIVVALSAYFVDRQILQAALECVRTFW